MNIVISTLPHTWILDLDGTIVVHNGYKDNKETLLDGVKEFWAQIPDNDYILILTARTIEQAEETEQFLCLHGLRFDKVLYSIPVGERILINDRKPSGLDMALALNKQRDATVNFTVTIDNSL